MTACQVGLGGLAENELPRNELPIWQLQGLDEAGWQRVRQVVVEVHDCLSGGLGGFARNELPRNELPMKQRVQQVVVEVHDCLPGG